MDEGKPVPSSDKTRQSILALTDSDAVYTVKDGPSNASKLDFMRTEFQSPSGDVFTDFPYKDIYDNGAVPAHQAAYYMCDLRVQALDYLLVENDGDVIDHLKKRLVNIMWKVRFRERINLHNMAVQARETRHAIH